MRTLTTTFVGLALAGCPAPTRGDASIDGSDAAMTDSATDARVTAIDFAFESEVTIRQATSGHLAFPDVARLRDGRLLVVYREGRTHVDASGRIMKQFGSADGQTWSAPEVLIDTPSIDDRDPSIAVLEGGVLVVNWFQYLPQGSLTGHHVYAVRSHDDGATFDAPVQVDPGELRVTGARLDSPGHWVDGTGQPVIVMATSSAVIADRARWLLPAYGGNALDLTSLSSTPRSRIVLYESTDLGDTWTPRPVDPTRATNQWLMEPAVLSLDDGSLLLQVRTASSTSPSSAGHMLQAVSHDGASFSDYVDLGFVGHAAEMLQLQNGVVVSAFRHLDDALTAEDVEMMVSLDRGATWGERIVVSDCGAVECGYPGALELTGGRLLVVFYSPGGSAIEAVTYTFATR